jgi:adenosylmethionine-8-amino-7-oxononanoate aminotransferase
MPLPLQVVGAEGCTLALADGKRLIDGLSSWWTACHGYRHPALVEAVQAQAQTLSHVMFAGLVHAPAMELAEKLIEVAPKGLAKVFFSDSGSTAIEVAMKMAVQFWHHQGFKRRQRFISFQHGYHGDTMGAMSLADPVRGMHSAFDGYMPRQASVAIPMDEYAFAEFEALLDGLKGEIAAVVIEPLVQAAGGMRFHSPDVLAEIYRIAKKVGVLFIADEIATGFGRTGSLFACEEAGITPDILCLGKALTGGMLTMGATLATGEVFAAFLSEDPSKAFMHGPTYMANPLACRAALASLGLFHSEPRLQQVEAIEAALHRDLAPCRTLPHVVDVRVKGAIGVVEFDPAFYALPTLRRAAPDYGVWLRPFGNVLYVTPPFVIAEAELKQLTDACYGLLRDHVQPHGKSVHDMTD